MTPGFYALQVYRGDSYRFQFTLFDDVNQTLPSDLTGVAVFSQIRDRPGGTLICSLECTVTPPNVVLVYLSAGNSGLLPMSAVWDLQLVYPSEDVATVLAGPVNVTTDVTSLADLPAPAAPLMWPRRRAPA